MADTAKQNINLKTFIVYWLPPLAWMAFIFPTNESLSSHNTSQIIIPVLKWFLPYAGQATIDALHALIRKFAHFFSYALLAFLLLRAFRGNNSIWRPQWAVYAGLIAIGYGLLDEYAQTFIQSRTGSFYDWLIDSSGVIVMMGLISLKNKTPHRTGR
ncbi:MAG: VanZ family protein [Nitrospira sp.]|nr:VanZ family protein [Nitrospira sp.]